MNEKELPSGTDRETDSLDKSLLDSLGNSQIIDSAVDAAEQALDTLLSDGIIKDIPVLGHAVKLWRGTIEIRSYLFARKLLRFLAPLNKISQEDREKFLTSLDTDPKQRKRVGEHLLLLIERMDDLEKPDILARAFCAYVAGTIDYDTFRQVSFAIDHCSLSDLLALREQVKFDYHHYDESVGAWIYEGSYASVSRLAAGGILFDDGSGIIVTDVGKLIVQILRN
jgi:hypothetical protein